MEHKTVERRASAFSLWLSWQELSGRKTAFVINVIIVALLIALPVSLDLMGNARKSSVGTRIDFIGPSLIIVPNGVLSSDLVTARLNGKVYPSSVLDNIRNSLSRHIRSAEPRLTMRFRVDGRDMPAAGIDFRNAYSYPFRDYSISSNEILLGTVSAEKLNKGLGDELLIKGRTFRIAGIIPTAGGIDDVSLFLSLPVVQQLSGQEGHINEIRIFPESLSSYEKLKGILGQYTDGLNMIDAYRGDTAEKQIDSELINYQKALYTIAFTLIAFCIMISTYINLDGRKTEVSTVFTLGAAQGIIFQILTFRTLWITLLGSLSGQCIALLFTVFQDYEVPLRFIWSANSFFLVVLVTVVLGVIVTIPFAFYSVYRRDPVEEL